MRRTWLVLLVGTLLAWNAAAQNPSKEQTDASAKSSTSASAQKSGAQASGSASTSASAQTGQNSISLSNGTTFEAALSSSLDARKNKEGDQVVARTTQAVKSDGNVVFPKGCKLIGHVTQAKARAKGESESALGIVFDKAILKHGQEVPINVVIQAVAAAQAAASAPLGEGDVMGSASGRGSAAGTGHASGGGLVGGAGSTVGAAAGTVTNTAGAVGSTAGAAVGSTVNTAASAAGSAGGGSAAGLLSSSNSGVIGLKGLTLNSEAANATQGSLITSSSKNVHLDSGTRMLLRAQSK